MISDFAYGVFFLVWALVAAYWDVKVSTVLALWLVIMPPVAATFHLLDLSLPLAIMYVVALVSTEFPLPIQIPSFGAFFALAFYLGQPLLAISALVIWLVWVVRLIGGGDALALLSLGAIFPSYQMLGSIMGALLLWGIVIIFKRGDISRVYLVFVRMRLGDHPTASELAESGAPAMPAILFAVIIYFVLVYALPL